MWRLSCLIQETYSRGDTEKEKLKYLRRINEAWLLSLLVSEGLNGAARYGTARAREKKVQVVHIYFFFFLQQNMVSLISGLNEEAVLNNGNNNNSAGSQLKKGILWQQRDKIFSRWKERFFVLTNDYLQCFKKGSSRITEMGGFIYGLRLSEVILYDATVL